MDEIAYRPQNVRETLVDLKDASELAIDLGYAAALYGNDELAEEVLALEERAESLQYAATIALMLSAKRAADAERLVGIVQIVDAAVGITNAAADIAGIVLKDIGLPEEIRSALPEADEVVVRATVAEATDAVGRSLADLALETETGVHVTAVRRGTEWTVSPDDEFVLRAGDVVIGSGPDDGATEVYELLTGELRTNNAESRIEVEQLRRAAETVVRLKNIAELAVGLAYSAVLFDDADLAAEVVELEEQSDALKTDIETWVVEASEHVRDPGKLRGLLRLAEASETICDAARDMASIVLREGNVHPVFGEAIRESEELIATVTVGSGSTVAGRTPSDVNLEERTGMTVMAIRRGGDWLVGPGDDTELLADDVLIARGPEEGVDRLREWAAE